MRYKLNFAVVLTGTAFFYFITAFSLRTNNVENDPPAVRITTPLNNTRFQWNAMVNYAISVSDKEDGTTEYNEITPAEVLLKVHYLQDSSLVKKNLPGKTKNEDLESAGLSLMIKSSCFTCHAAKNKLIGPAFEQVAKRYPNNTNSIDMLAKKIIKGSTGVWGITPMPPHPDLNTGQAIEIIRWVLKNNMDPDVTYFTGIQGAFRTRQKPEKDAGKGVYVLTAIYTDHGLNGLAQSNKRGEHTIILKNN